MGDGPTLKLQLSPRFWPHWRTIVTNCHRNELWFSGGFCGTSEPTFNPFTLTLRPSRFYFNISPWYYAPVRPSNIIVYAAVLSCCSRATSMARKHKHGRSRFWRPTPTACLTQRIYTSLGKGSFVPWVFVYFEGLHGCPQFVCRRSFRGWFVFQVVVCLTFLYHFLPLQGPNADM